MRRAKERLELAQGAGSIGVFELNIRTDEVEWSATEEELFGIPIGTFNGRLEGWIAALHPDDREQAVAACMKAVAARSDWRRNSSRPSSMPIWTTRGSTGPSVVAS